MGPSGLLSHVSASGGPSRRRDLVVWAQGDPPVDAGVSTRTGSCREQPPAWGHRSRGVTTHGTGRLPSDTTRARRHTEDPRVDVGTGTRPEVTSARWHPHRSQDCIGTLHRSRDRTTGVSPGNRDETQSAPSVGTTRDVGRVPPTTQGRETWGSWEWGDGPAGPSPGRGLHRQVDRRGRQTPTTCSG